MRHALIVIAAVAAIAACASPGLPPGGPTVSAFPRVIATLPETGAVNVRPNKVLVRYDDVIGEQAAGGPLARNVLISPWDGEPRVEWRRTGLSVQPRTNWRANTAYTITVLPGLSDLRGQQIPYGYVLRFSTGATIPTSVIRGVAFDWIQNRALPKATILAIDTKDTSIVHLTVADSTGRFELGAVPAGRYLMRAIDERTPNRALDPREPWDTATITLLDSARTDLYVFVHDTTPARITELRMLDSASIAIVLDKPLQPGVTIPGTAARVLGADSLPVVVRSIVTGADERAARATADSLARTRDTSLRTPDANVPPRRTIDPMRRLDTLPVVAVPVPTRPAPSAELVIKLQRPLPVGATYRVTLTGLRNLLGNSGTTSRLLIVPKPAPADTTATTPSTRPPAQRRDSTTRPIPTSTQPIAPLRPPR